MSDLTNWLDRIESDYSRIEIKNTMLDPIASFVLDFVLAAKVEADFVDAPIDTPFSIWLDDDILGAGADPAEAITDARAQLFDWIARERREAMLPILSPPYVIPRA